MKVRHFRRQFQGLWRHLSRLAIAVICLELVLVVIIVHRADAAEPVPPPAVIQSEKLAS